MNLIQNTHDHVKKPVGGQESGPRFNMILRIIRVI